MKEGFSIRKIPEQSYKICNGCEYLNTSAMMRGHKSVTNNFTCTHPEFEGESGLFSNKRGRQIHFNHEGDCATPNWCPFLNKKQNEKANTTS